MVRYSSMVIGTHTHTHTHTTILQPTGFCSGLPELAGTRKVKPGRWNQSGFTAARDSEWQWHQLGHMQICTLTHTHNHTSIPPLNFYRPPNQQHESTEGKVTGIYKENISSTSLCTSIPHPLMFKDTSFSIHSSQYRNEEIKLNLIQQKQLKDNIS